VMNVRLLHCLNTFAQEEEIIPNLYIINNSCTCSEEKCVGIHRIRQVTKLNIQSLVMKRYSDI
jgi:hypothetical protein